jgi:hypothetical protein
VTEFAASGARRSVDQVVQLKVALTGFRPPLWRSVQLPAVATLGDLHEVIQVLFGWDGDHLHFFTVRKRQYSDPFVSLDGTGDEEELRVRDALAEGTKKISYEYDLGASWQHEITLETTLAREPGRDYPVCTGFKGDSPVEYWSEEDPEEPQPFNLAEINKKLAALGQPAAM